MNPTFDQRADIDHEFEFEDVTVTSAYSNSPIPSPSSSGPVPGDSPPSCLRPSHGGGLSLSSSLITDHRPSPGQGQQGTTIKSLKRSRRESISSDSSSTTLSIHGPPAKIQVLSTMNQSFSSTMKVESSQPRFKRDEDYYFEDGSCILLVQDTLFNVHRSILSRDSSSFGTMFSLPHGETEAEGKSDTNPVILVGDTVAEFKHFLWALYALPPELRLVTAPDADLTRLIDITCIANKYSFRTTEIWALDAIQEYVNQKPCPILGSLMMELPSGDVMPSHRDSQPLQNAAQLTQLIRLAQLCHHDRLLNTLISLLKQLMGTSVHYAYLAMTIADEYGLRSLKGTAYLEVMQKSCIVNSSGADPFPIPAVDTVSQGANGSLMNSNAPRDMKEGRLTLLPSQRLRLLSGHYRLTIAWERLRLTPPQFAHTVSCGATWHQHGCTQSWLEFWKEKTKSDAVLSLGPADVLGRMKQLTKDFDRWGSATYMHHDCRVAARKSIQDAAKAIEDALPDYFSDEEGLGLVL